MALAASDAFEEDLSRGADLFGAHCSVCHGDLGRGDGPAAPWLFPAARDFGQARFRLVSTENGIPTTDDLVRTLRRGVPGSAMPAWGGLSEDSLRRLALHVQLLAVDGHAEVLASELSDSGRGVTYEQAYATALETVTPGPVIDPLGDYLVTDPLLARGRELFLQGCASCHGEAGRGHADPRHDESGQPNWARDFVAGFLKGGASPEELHRRIRCGMPGSAMPATRFEDPKDHAALVAHVRSLIPPGSEYRLVHRRSRITAHHTARVPESPVDPAWDTIEETMVVLSPLWWNADSILEAYVAACHDGESVSLRVRWSDGEAQSNAYSDVGRSDGVALQFSTSPEPPIFAMGAAGESTAIWHWKSLRLEEVAGGLDALDRWGPSRTTAGRSEVTLDVASGPSSRETMATSTTAEHLTAEGVGALTAHREVAGQGTGSVAGPKAEPLWEEGTWRVVFTRALGPESSLPLVFRPGETIHLALALWNGSAGHGRGQKSISIWQELVLADQP